MAEQKLRKYVWTYELTLQAHETPKNNQGRAEQWMPVPQSCIHPSQRNPYYYTRLTTVVEILFSPGLPAPTQAGCSLPCSERGDASAAQCRHPII
jgi:hypothetical protein